MARSARLHSSFDSMFGSKNGDPYSMMESGGMEPTGEFYDQQVRKGFMTKVFGILSAQLLLTTVVAGAFMSSPDLGKYIQANPWPIWVSLGVSFAVLITFMCNPALTRSFPANYCLLGLFTAAEAVMVGTICMFANTSAVLIAAGITTGIVFALTLYALQTKYDFTMAGGVLIGLLVALMIAGIIKIFLPHSKVLELVFAGCGALLFSAYLVFDIQRLMYGRENQISVDDYVLAAISIYLDIINIFLYILRIVQELQGRN